MQRAWLQAEKGEEVPFNLWSSKYHRVLGTGLQQSKGLQGGAGFDDMPGVADKCSVFPGPNGDCTDGNKSDEKEEAARRYLTDKLINEQKGQVSAWMVEHLRFYPDDKFNKDYPKEHEHKTEQAVAEVNSQGSWYSPHQAHCEAHDYHSEWDQEAWGTGSYGYKEHTAMWKNQHPQCVKPAEGTKTAEDKGHLLTKELMLPFMNGMVHDAKDIDAKTKKIKTGAKFAAEVKARNCEDGYSCVVLPDSQRDAWMKWVNNNVEDQAITLSKFLDDNGEFRTDWPEEITSRKNWPEDAPGPKWGEWLKSPTQWKDKQYWTDLECVPGYSWDYAGSFGTVASSHFVNEISIQPQGCKFLPDGSNYCTYANIVPECRGTEEDPKHLSEPCIAAIDVLYAVGWPGTYRAHALGYKNDIAVPSIALILGALLRRAHPEEKELDGLYKAMLAEAGPPATAGEYPGMPTEDSEPLVDDVKPVLLMSSHDITSNLMRITMQMAFGDEKVAKRTTFNDGSKTMMPNQIAYSAMFSFAVYGTKVQVKNFNLSLRQSAYGCKDEGELDHHVLTDLFKEGPMEVKQFVKTMAETLYAKTTLTDAKTQKDGKQATTMHSSVTQFLAAAKDI